MALLRKIGGLWHWRLGRIGGSFYVAKPRPKARHIVMAVSVSGTAMTEFRAFGLIARCERICRARKPEYMPNRTAVWGIV